MMWVAMSSNSFAFAKSATAKLKMKMKMKMLPAGFALDVQKKWGLKSEKVLHTATRSKKHETIVEGQQLPTAHIMERACSRLRFLLRK